MGCEGDGGEKRRGRNAAATREAILAAARRAFTGQAYDQVGLREIAADAGIDPALVIRYFGSKEGLFAEAVGKKFELSPLFASDTADLGERLARSILAKKAVGDGFDPMLALLRSAPSEEGGRLMRAAFDESFVRPLASRLTGPHAELRAGLIGAILVGILVGRSVVRSRVMAEADEAELGARVARSIQRLVDDA